MLQEGLKAKIIEYYTADTNGKKLGDREAIPIDYVTVFELYISDRSVELESRKRNLDHVLPVFFLSLRELFMTYFYIWRIRYNLSFMDDKKREELDLEFEIFDEIAIYIAGFDTLLILLVVGSMFR